jgi:hypothetical protein
MALGAEQTVLIVGFGNAGQRLHANTAVDGGDYPDVTTVAYDPDPNKLAFLFDASRERLSGAHESGRLILAREIAVRPADVVVIASSPGTHVQAIEEVLDAYAKAGFSAPKAWGIEKAIVSTPDEKKWLMSLLEEGGPLNPDDVFVNETRILSLALHKAAGRARELESSGRSIVAVDALTQKNRIPQVKAGRFSGRPFDVESPHALVAAQTLAGVQLGPDSIDRNILYTNIDGTPQSEGTYTRLHMGALTVQLAQGLGEFTMDYDGNMFRNQNPDTVRTVQATFDNGDRVRVRFDPIADMPQYTSTFEHVNGYGAPVTPYEVFPEIPTKVLMDALLRHARGEDAGLPPGARIEPALVTAELLIAMNDSAVRIDNARTA